MTEKKYDILRTVSGDYPTTFNKVYLNRKRWQPADPGKVLSFMPGTVERICVKPGDQVKEGDLLMIFRAMKMNNNILSPVSGTVRSVEVEEGVNIPKNTLMVDIG